MRRTSLIFMLGALLFTGCGRVSVIGEKKMEAVLYDLHLTDALISKEMQGHNTLSDSLKNNMYASVFNRHGVTKEQFDSSVVWYSYRMDKYVRIYKNLSNRFNDEYLRYEGLVKAELERIDTVELWKLAPRLTFSNQMFPMVVHFNDTVGTVKRNDTLVLSFDVFGVSANMRHLPRVAFSLHYPDTVDTRRVSIDCDSLYTLTMPILPGKKPDSLSGHFFVRPHHNNFYRILFDNISLKQISPSQR